MFTKEKTIAEFITHARCTKNPSDKTLCAYRSDLTLFHRWEIENPNQSILDYIAYLLATRHKVSTIKRRLSSLSGYFAYVYRSDKKHNPMNDLDIKLKSERALPKTIPINEMKKLFFCLIRLSDSECSAFQQFQITRDLALLDIVSSTGIRIGEAATITLQDLDLRNRTILIHGKGRKERLLYLSCAETLENIKKWLIVRKKNHPALPFVFLNRNLGKMSVHAIEDVFRKYRDLAGINPNATPHYLRHTFATNLLANGSDIRSVQEILGHSSIAITERYTEVTQIQKIKILRKYNYRNNLTR